MTMRMTMRFPMREVVVVVVAVAMSMSMLLVAVAAMGMVMGVAMRMLAMRVRVRVGISTATMRVPTVRVRMVMTMVMMAKRKHPDQINQQPERADHKQLHQSLRLPPFQYPLAGLKHNLNADKNQEQPVGEAAQCLDLAETVRKPLARRPFARDSGEQPHR